MTRRRRRRTKRALARREEKNETRFSFTAAPLARAAARPSYHISTCVFWSEVKWVHMNTHARGITYYASSASKPSVRISPFSTLTARPRVHWSRRRRPAIRPAFFTTRGRTPPPLSLAWCATISRRSCAPAFAVRRQPAERAARHGVLVDADVGPEEAAGEIHGGPPVAAVSARPPRTPPAPGRPSWGNAPAARPARTAAKPRGPSGTRRHPPRRFARRWPPRRARARAERRRDVVAVEKNADFAPGGRDGGSDGGFPPTPSATPFASPSPSAASFFAPSLPGDAPFATTPEGRSEGSRRPNRRRRRDVPPPSAARRRRRARQHELQQGPARVRFLAFPSSAPFSSIGVRRRLLATASSCPRRATGMSPPACGSARPRRRARRPGPARTARARAARSVAAEVPTSKPLRVNHRRSVLHVRHGVAVHLFVLSPADDREATENARGSAGSWTRRPRLRHETRRFRPSPRRQAETRLGSSPFERRLIRLALRGRLLLLAGRGAHLDERGLAQVHLARHVREERVGGNPSLPASAVRAGIEPRVHTTASFAACRCLKSSIRGVFLGEHDHRGGVPRGTSPW